MASSLGASGRHRGGPVPRPEMSGPWRPLLRTVLLADRTGAGAHVEDPTVMISVAGWCLALALVSTIVGLPIVAIRRSSQTAARLARRCHHHRPGGPVGGAHHPQLARRAWCALSIAVLIGIVGCTLWRQGFAGLPPIVRRLDPGASPSWSCWPAASDPPPLGELHLPQATPAATSTGPTGTPAPACSISGFPPLFPMLLGPHLARGRHGAHHRYRPGSARRAPAAADPSPAGPARGPRGGEAGRHAAHRSAHPCGLVLQPR